MPALRSPTGRRPLPLAFLLALAPALALSGCKKAPLGPPPVQDMVQVTVDKHGFSPDRITARRGKPLTMVFNRIEEKTCATEVVIASEHIRKELPMNTSVPVVFIPEKAGELKFACPMNMVVGTITVVN